jgi:hypothetical protein
LAFPGLITRVLFEVPHLRAEVDYSKRIVLLTRTALAFERIEELDATVTALRKNVPDSLRTGYGVLLDMRVAPTSVHASLEPGFARYRNETERGFSHAVVLVKTTLGRIRADRLGEKCTVPVDIVDDPVKAIETFGKR